MTDLFETDVHDYLLDQMEPGRRLAFEHRLERDPVAAAVVKETTDALAGLACAATRTAPGEIASDHAALFAIVAAVRGPDVAPAGRSKGWIHLSWAAAVLLLGLNLVDFRRPFMPWPTDAGSEPASRPAAATTVTSSDRTLEKPDELRTEESSAPRLETGPAVAVLPTVQAAGELQRLRGNVEELRRAHEQIRREYDLLVRRLNEEAQIERNLNRLLTMELVDAFTYARGERRGLVNVGRGILTEPGVVTAPDTGPPPDAASTAPRPYAWAVFDERDQRGFLNLYQLPGVGENQQMHVWVRPTDSTTYQRVSEISAPLGGTVRVQYTLPPESRPAEILVTVEPRDVVPTAPRGAVVLRGP